MDIEGQTSQSSQSLPTNRAVDGLPILTLRLHSSPIYALSFADEGDKAVLVTGCGDCVGVWDWDLLLATGDVEAGRVASLDTGSVAHLSVEANAVVSEGSWVYAGLGSGKVSGWDLGKLEAESKVTPHLELAGHDDMVLALSGRGKARGLVSGSEDGTVRVWDVREGAGSEVVLNPGSGKWVGALDVDPEGSWMACGGADGEVSVWHLGSVAQTTVMDVGSPVQSLVFADEHILVGSASSVVSRWSISGSLAARLSVSAPSVFAIALNENNPRNRVCVIGGASPNLDVYTNYFHRAFALSAGALVRAPTTNERSE